MKIPCPNPKCPYGKDGMCIRIPCVYEKGESKMSKRTISTHCRVFYKCDHEKASKTCKQSGCKYIGTGDCEATSNIDYAQIDADGKPLCAYMLPYGLHEVKRK